MIQLNKFRRSGSFASFETSIAKGKLKTIRYEKIISILFRLADIHSELFISIKAARISSGLKRQRN